jgi:citrate synthase
MPEFARGLEGVVVASSSMSKVFGEEGNLVYRGVSIHDLARHSSFEEVVYLLWYGQLPRRSELDAFTAQLASQRRVPDAVLEWILQAPREDSMATLRTAVSMLSGYDADGNDTSLEAGRRKAERLVAMIATLVAAIGRVRDGGAPLPPDAELSHAANFLYMLSGERPSNEATRTFDQALVLHADHGFNASTFAARVTTSTLSDVHSAIVSAIGTLKGASHGGANARVMQMLLEIESSGEKPEAWVRQALERRQRIMGFGHRVYKAEDPRATHLRRSSEVLSQTTEDGKWFRMSQAIEQVLREEKGLYPNVDFYSASTYYMLGIPTHLYTPIFALSRVAGWTAHVLEQMQDNRLIRPRSNYTGPENVTYEPLDAR